MEVLRCIQIDAASTQTRFRTQNADETLDFVVDVENPVVWQAVVNFDDFRNAVRGCKNKAIELELVEGKLLVDRVQDYKRHVFMLWSPVVKDGKNSQLKKLQDIQSRLRVIGIELELVVNAEYREKMKKLEDFAVEKTEELKPPILRFLQIRGYLDKHLASLERRARTMIYPSEASEL